MPDSHLAYEQIRACFSDQRDALRFVCELFYEKHKDEWSYKAQTLALAAWSQDAKIAYRCAWLLHCNLGRYEGSAMARVMSFVMTVFIIIPIIAPALGQGMLLLAGWRAIFASFLILALLTLCGSFSVSPKPCRRKKKFRSRSNGLSVP